ncbi:MAG: hypothetical protein DRQ37_03075 [Gammaproteobacteria bacterium]|nr:MAG: hypothetical protein DRQ37_03075 [Gammaproteobacteria bacterium]
MNLRLYIRLALAIFLLLPMSVAGAGAGPRAPVQALHGTLLEVMHDAKSLGFAGRRERLAPVVHQGFDMPYITRLVAGAHWKKMSAEQRARLIDIFSQLTVATYAGRFDRYAGEEFAILAERELKKGRRLIRSRLTDSVGKDIRLDYVLHRTDGGWRIVNVVANGISDLSLKRADYTIVLRDGGFGALVGKLEKILADYTGTINQ